MAKRKVVKIGDPLLRKTSKPVRDFDDDLIDIFIKKVFSEKEFWHRFCFMFNRNKKLGGQENEN